MRSAFIALALSTLGCSASPTAPTPLEVATAADEASLVLASEMALLVVPGNLDPAATPEETALAAVMAAPDAFDPVTCVVATADGATVTYVLDGCRGSFGLVRATGTMTVTFLDDALPGSAFTASATELSLREGTVSFTVDARVVRDGATRTIEATTSSMGTSPAGRAFERSGEVTARWMDSWGCLFVDSAALTTEVSGRSWGLDISALTYCVGECPMTGGSMTLTGDDALRIDYVGTSAARWSVSDTEEMGDLPIACGV